MDLKEEETLGDQVGSHWYYRAKAAALMQQIGGRVPTAVLDIGAGSGFFSRRLLEAGAARATCVDTGYDEEHDELWIGKPIAFRRSIQTSDADLVLAMDVIEHVPDEAALLKPYVDLVPCGTRFIVSVPAFQFLWSSHDIFLKHYRRYTLAGLEEVLRRSGLEIDWSHYYYGGIFPLAAVSRLLERGRRKTAAKSQLRRHGALENALLAAICAAERPFMRTNRLFGLTAFAGCHKT